MAVAKRRSAFTSKSSLPPTFTRSLSRWTPNRIWVYAFGAWTLLLSGVFTPVTGTPGFAQWMKLRSLLDGKRQKIIELEERHAFLEDEIRRLEKSSAHQEREIRKVLGYVAPGELIFDFTPSSSLQ